MKHRRCVWLNACVNLVILPRDYNVLATCLTRATGLETLTGYDVVGVYDYTPVCDVQLSYHVLLLMCTCVCVYRYTTKGRSLPPRPSAASRTWHWAGAYTRPIMGSTFAAFVA